MKKKVLIADDNKWLRETTKEIIEGKIGLEVHEASNGKEVLNSLKKNSFDLLIVDIAMPKINGLELIDKLRARGDAIPIIVLSGVLGYHIKKHMYSKDDSIKIIERPFSIGALAETIEEEIS